MLPHPSSPFLANEPTSTSTCSSNSNSTKTIFSLPDEILIACLANLEPQDLRLASMTCARFCTIVNDDSCWRSALLAYFGYLPTRRVSKASWKQEYLKRSRFLKCLSWDRMRGRHVLQFDPRIGTVDHIHVDFEEGRMLAASLDQGLISACNPSTGKVERSISCTGDLLAPVPVSCIKLEKFRIAVGYTTGHIGIITNFRDRTDPPLKVFRESHHGSSTELCWVPTLVGAIVSGGVDGRVFIWDITTLQRVRILTGNTSKILKMACDATRHVIAGTESGSLVIWDLDISSHISQSLSSAAILNGLDDIAAASVQSLAPARIVGPVPSAMEDRTPQVVDMMYDPKTATAIVATKVIQSDLAIRRIDVSTGNITGVFVQGHGAFPPTILAWDRLHLGPNDKRQSILVSGDSGGNVCIWTVVDVESRPLAAQVSLGNSSHQVVSSEVIRFKPTHVIHNVHGQGVLSLHLDPFKVITGGGDGGAKVFDVMTGKCIRTCAVREGRGGSAGNVVAAAGVFNNNPDNTIVSRKSVKAVWGGPYQTIAACGNQIRTWDFAPVEGAGSRPFKHRKNRKQQSRNYPGGGNSNTPKKAQSPHVSHLDWEDVRDVVREREYERTIFDRRARNIRHVNGEADMTEEEFVSYALLLSVEEAERDAVRRTLSSASSPQIIASCATSDENNPASFASRGSSHPTSFLCNGRRSDDERDEDDDYGDDDVDASSYMSYGSYGSQRGCTPSTNMSRNSMNNPNIADDWPELEASFGNTGGGTTSRTSLTPPSVASSMSRSSTSYNEREPAWMQRSPRLVPNMGRSASHSSVSVTRGRSEDEDLTYALEVSLVEK
ncbi:hypothetical protein SeLEV6574_g07950 [Synchytrium endobioticum]|uniref:F-box domain-containing protein n=1 Tax=Synchytrium endobioticum TaxID=286115 RepID=A0A507C6P9_9FUNG|nr:hypothetical protein SeLEV6574_g07950 [Synchytrium endobioticum]